ncbi:hypothetical protein BLNAU_7085 [Blattamonas nauphoetae]|uniref:Uncharacterized protein n=1 Tax=Blattamonas nauphoetae TaxID=2049346 RepID=A0ABQ9Y2M5_9EUKA|nr:hypothetical protein BLNAU_7085 [Blattamonas nauphoetae]
MTPNTNQWSRSELLTSSSSITCHGLHLSNTHLIRGTGPLCDLEGLSVSSTKNVQFSSLLASSFLSNVTSCRLSRNGASSAVHPSQRIVGCRVTDCSNHLYGTACRDMNAGGNLLSHNTSFLRCTTEAPTHQNEYLSIRTVLSPSITFHFFRLCTFKGCVGTGVQGGAI